MVQPLCHETPLAKKPGLVPPPEVLVDRLIALDAMVPCSPTHSDVSLALDHSTPPTPPPLTGLHNEDSDEEGHTMLDLSPTGRRCKRHRTLSPKSKKQTASTSSSSQPMRTIDRPFWALDMDGVSFVRATDTHLLATTHAKTVIVQTATSRFTLPLWPECPRRVLTCLAEQCYQACLFEDTLDMYSSDDSDTRWTRTAQFPHQGEDTPFLIEAAGQRVACLLGSLLYLKSGIAYTFALWPMVWQRGLIEKPSAWTCIPTPLSNVISFSFLHSDVLADRYLLFQNATKVVIWDVDALETIAEHAIDAQYVTCRGLIPPALHYKSLDTLCQTLPVILVWVSEDRIGCDVFVGPEHQRQFVLPLFTQQELSLHSACLDPAAGSIHLLHSTKEGALTVSHCSFSSLTSSSLSPTMSRPLPFHATDRLSLYTLPGTPSSLLVLHGQALYRALRSQ